MTRKTVIVIYLMLNLAVFLLYGIDKLKAKKHRYRISEKTLLITALFAPAGALLGMYTFHHKTRKPIFFILVPLMLMTEIALYLYICR